MQLSLYDRLGGSAGVHAVVEALYVRLLEDPEIALFFEGVDIDSMKRRQRVYMCQLFGGPMLTEAPDLSAVHAHLVAGQGLDDSHYDKFLECLGKALIGLNVQIHLAAEIETQMESLRPIILGRAARKAA
jgi:hemoglobin